MVDPFHALVYYDHRDDLRERERETAARRDVSDEPANYSSEPSRT